MPHVELYARDLESRGLAAATVALKLVVLTGFYRYCVEEQLLEQAYTTQLRLWFDWCDQHWRVPSDE